MKFVYLIGFRGAGKTTLGKLAAADLGWKFRDLDEEWEARNGQSIVDFVEANGVARFRELECELLWESVTWPEPMLVATGGGVVETPASLDFLAQSLRPKILLDASPEQLWERLRNSAERRKIGGLSTPLELERLLAIRLPLYEKIANYRVKNRDITQALVEIKQLAGSL